MNEPKYPSLKQPQYSVRIEQNLLDRVEAYCEKHSLSKTEFAKKAFELLLVSGSDAVGVNASNGITRQEFDSTIQQINSKLEKPVDTVPRDEFLQLASKVEQLASNFENLGKLAA